MMTRILGTPMITAGQMTEMTDRLLPVPHLRPQSLLSYLLLLHHHHR